ncbi:uncharacterized protein BT62DRAFT_996037 [Guyanagaster necrorhizus]|uniref:Uncharacterized protein n=1 Tax=Guyanagaster necrorhizus TaxID=856835 RepID=A0A9P8AQ60_9AGAR|nr:uncharacterized protein BT62DRAFT_996037 [Guyanagaster necrorhizus MCA 3950]KAG7443496.1 hypothetical protein BT62DRAFT_996037 [Guyanagaster necrorhizus MCA 3950]
MRLLVHILAFVAVVLAANGGGPQPSSPAWTGYLCPDTDNNGHAKVPNGLWRRDVPMSVLCRATYYNGRKKRSPSAAAPAPGDSYAKRNIIRGSGLNVELTGLSVHLDIKSTCESKGRRGGRVTSAGLSFRSQPGAIALADAALGMTSKWELGDVAADGRTPLDVPLVFFSNKAIARIEKEDFLRLLTGRRRLYCFSQNNMTLLAPRKTI